MTILLVGCAPSTVGGSAVILDEFHITAARTLDFGLQQLEVTNSGEFGHTLVVSTRDGTVLASTAVLPPGASTVLRLELVPGEYQLSCRIVVQVPDGSIVDHYAEGMVASVTVSGR